MILLVQWKFWKIFIVLKENFNIKFCKKYRCSAVIGCSADFARTQASDWLEILEAGILTLQYSQYNAN